MKDLISRQAALDGIKSFVPHKLKDDATSAEKINYVAWCCALNCAEIFVRSMPSAKRQGHWISGKCDQCGSHAPYWAMASTYYQSTYCPSCGAKMERE